MTPGEVVRTFISRIEALDVEGATALLAEDVLYDNVPMPDIHGREQVRAVLGAFMGKASRVEWEIVRQVEAGGTVLNERVDRFEYPTHRIEIPVAGVFEVVDGLITLWRDYFDLQTYRNQSPG